ncbi:uncharacterized protein EV420DRAFT_1036156 [Desarmillaria tabescens]|uniref:Uncharacterized protein n=1 Tax=Armillaria tabescens TaxID=1929756 RepID=A0AA39NER0_ARMTA|nr:uncharacterized protein EV420DRAFT_1036156 [Desarmillaria tabescens]KAK0464296.1 hypothetical protein EV420DRAFT_1036156 [Desarmillaria tabescens]
MSVIASRIARPLRISCTRGLSRIRIPHNEVSINLKYLTDAHEREITRLQCRYENQLSELRQELESLKDANRKWEQRQRKSERERAEQEREREREMTSRSRSEEQLMRDKIQLLHKVAWLRQDVSAAPSLRMCLFPHLRKYHTHLTPAGIIDSIYRQRLEDALGPLLPGPQSVLSAIINSALDTPSHTYARSRQKAISLVDPTLEKDDVDLAGHNLYRACLEHVPIQEYSLPIDLREGQLSLPSVAAFFALAHWSRVEISVDYRSKGGELVASIEGSSYDDDSLNDIEL